MSLEQEQMIAALCQTMWHESPKNQIAGLVEEAMEVVEASGQLTEQEAISLAAACIKRAYSEAAAIRADEEPSVKKSRFTEELFDLYIMICCCRLALGYQIGDLCVNGSQKIVGLWKRWKFDPTRFANKIDRKKKAGLRF